MTRVVLIGPPGGGKGTQATALSAALGVPAISTGELFRAERDRGTPRGRMLGEVMARGELVPDEVGDPMVMERLSQPDAARGWILDGYPRSPEQADALDAFLAGRGESIDHALVLEVPRAELLRRLTARAARDEDRDPAVSGRRIDTYEARSRPVIERWRARGRPRVHPVEGVGAVEAVTARLLAALDLAR